MTNPDVSYPLDDDTPTSHLPFSPCVVVGDLIFVSGQASVDKQGKIIPGDIEQEVRRSIANIQAVLKTAGADLSHVVQTRNYVRLDEDLAKYNEIYCELFPDPKPARTTITRCLTDALRYEIECIAVRPKR
ncbi:MAG: RidA family protein [Planctomycetales bacterium]|nr:RidA family protein [Planctomycetales bacterium]